MTKLPSKAELLESKLVDVDQQHKKAITNTLQVASNFGKRPSEINRRINTLSKKGLCRIAPSYYLDQQSKQQKYYELNRDQFLLVVMGFTGDKADQFKAEFIQLFNQLEAELLQWRTGRLIASDLTKQANDQIHWLQAELEKVIPTSKRCTMLFVHIQQAITKIVTGSAKTKRFMMTAEQLEQIGHLEQQVQDHIKQLKHEGVAPEQIRDAVIDKIKKANKEQAPTTCNQTNKECLDDAS